MDVATAVLTFIDFSVRLTKAVTAYTNSVKNYPKTLDDFITELNMVQGNLRNLLKLIEQNPDGSYARLGGHDGPLQRCQKELEDVLETLHKRSKKPSGGYRERAAAGFRRLVWPLSEEEVQGFLAVIQRYTAQFDFGVGIDTNQRITKLEQDGQEKKYVKVLRWLSTIEFRQRHDFIRQQRQHDTGGWLFKNLQYKGWADVQYPGSLLWLNGIHGSGKSVLVSMVIDEMTTTQKNKGAFGGAFLYCTFDDQETTNPSAILRSILVQLLSQRLEKAGEMLKEFEKRMNLGQGTPVHLDELTEKINQASGFYDKTTIIIDALDECDTECREHLISLLVKLPCNSQGRIRLLVSSRPDHDIRELLTIEPEDRYRSSVRSISLSEESDNLKADVGKYIHGCFQISRRLKKIEIPLRIEIISALLERDTFFQLVRCQLDEISRCRSEESIRAALADLPRDLNETYKRVLRRIERPEDVDLATHTFLWLSTSKRALKLEEVVDSLAVKPGSTCLPPKLVILRETELLEICGSLVTYDDTTRYFSLSHFSVKEFLTSNWLVEQSGVSKFRIEPLDAERRLATSTLTYLSFDDFRQIPSKDILQRAKLLAYAAGYWTDHAKMAIPANDNEIHGLTKKLLLDPGYSGNYKTFLRTRLQSEHLKQTQNMSHIITNYEPDLCPLYYPVLCGLTTTVERFIELHPSWLDEPIGRYGTPLVIAAGQNDVSMIEHLLDLGADIDKGCSTSLWNEIRPLYYAIYLGNSEATDVLIRRGGDISLGCRYIDDHSKYGSPPLYTAAYWGNAGMISKLLKAGADLRAEDTGTTALYWALYNASLDAVKVLCENGSDPKLKGPSGKTAIQQALELRNVPIIEYLLNTAGDSLVGGALGNTQLDELEWARSESWYPRVVQLFRLMESSTARRIRHSPSDVYQAYSILRRSLRLPRSVTVSILDLAEYWVPTVAQRDELVVVTDGVPDRPYVAIKARGPARRVSFRTTSHDQGYSGEPENHGKYSGSHTWFEAGVLRPDFNHQSHEDSELRKERHLVQRNVCAESNARKHYNEWDFRGPSLETKNWFAGIKPGDVVALYPRAQFPGWMNYVESSTMELWHSLV